MALEVGEDVAHHERVDAVPVFSVGSPGWHAVVRVLPGTSFTSTKNVIALANIRLNGLPEVIGIAGLKSLKFVSRSATRRSLAIVNVGRWQVAQPIAVNVARPIVTAELLVGVTCVPALK